MVSFWLVIAIAKCQRATISGAVAATDKKPRYCRGPHNTCRSCWLGTAQQFHHDMRGEGGLRVTSKVKQGAHIHQPTA